jgi:predicted phosphodiesterase
VRYALISDIHANLPALDAVLRDIEQRADVATVYHLGDLVDYATPASKELQAITIRPSPRTTSIAVAATRIRDRKRCRT